MNVSLNNLDTFLDNNTNSNGWSDGIKRIAPSIVFDVVFPSLDVYSDFSLILGWYMNGHFKYAISMTIPIMLQFLFTIYKWIRLEKMANKKWTWPILLLQFWPQWRAIRIMRLDFRNDSKIEAKKKELMREVTSTEPFLEAFLSIIIMTIIFISALGDNSFRDNCSYNYLTNTWNEVECEEYQNAWSWNFQPPKYCTNHPEDGKCAVYGGFGGQAWFFTSFYISIITGTLGITKFLQVGPFSVLSTEGVIGGICKWRFLLTFLAVMMSLVTKGVFMGSYIAYFYAGNLWSNVQSKSMIKTMFGTSGDSETIVALLSLLSGLLIVINFLFAITCISCSTGINKKLIKVVLAYPAAWMLPIATYFAIGPINSSCCSKTRIDRHHLGFSKHLTIINIVLTMMIYATIISLFAAYDITLQLSDINWYMELIGNIHNINLYVIFVPLLILSLLFNIICLLLDENFCCQKSQNCFCSFCCSFECFKHDTFVIDTTTNDLEVVKMND